MDQKKHAEPSASLSAESMTIRQTDNVITLGCTACGVEIRSDMEPAAVLIDAVQFFAERHSGCL